MFGGILSILIGAGSHLLATNMYWIEKWPPVVGIAAFVGMIGGHCIAPKDMTSLDQTYLALGIATAALVMMWGTSIILDPTKHPKSEQ